MLYRLIDPAALRSGIRENSVKLGGEPEFRRIPLRAYPRTGPGEFFLLQITYFPGCRGHRSSNRPIDDKSESIASLIAKLLTETDILE
jgi:hypothetical protein